MFRRANLFAVVIALAVAYLLWKPLLVGSPLGPRQVLPDHDLVTGTYLDRRWPEVDFKNEKFSVVLDFVRDVTGSSYNIDWQALERAGITRNSTVNAHFKDVRSSQALDLILANVGNRSVPLASEIVDGVINITTKLEIDHGITMRTHDVGDLLTQQTDPFIIAFGFNPFHQAPSTPEFRIKAMEQRIRSRFGEATVPRNFIMLRKNSASITDIVVIQTRAIHQQVDADLDFQRWRPRAQAFALRAAALGLAALVTLRIATSTSRLRRRRLLKGLCPRCGYDLRATPQRCPECGQISQVAQTTAPA